MTAVTGAPRRSIALTPDALRQRTVVSVEEAAAVLDCGRRQAYEMAASGDLPTIKVGRAYKVPAAALLRMIGADPNAAA